MWAFLLGTIYRQCFGQYLDNILITIGKFFFGVEGMSFVIEKILLRKITQAQVDYEQNMSLGKRVLWWMIERRRLSYIMILVSHHQVEHMLHRWQP